MAEPDSQPTQPPHAADVPAWPGWPVAIATCIRFYSRLPVPALPGEATVHAAPDFRLIPRALPLAALALATPAALLLLAAGAAGVAPPLAATLAVAALALTTGGLHEDGLADSADGLFGGSTPERRLEIMKDSRLGSYGALALGLALLLRVTALASVMLAAGAAAAAAAILAAACWSRAAGLRLLANQPPARIDGASAAVGRPTPETVRIALGLSLAVGLAAVAATRLTWPGLLLGLALALAVAAWIASLARRLIGGQTGDIVGAAQQATEIALYVGFAFALGGAGR